MPLIHPLKVAAEVVGATAVGPEAWGTLAMEEAEEAVPLLLQALQISRCLSGMSAMVW
jgi:hypothetical protein